MKKRFFSGLFLSFFIIFLFFFLKKIIAANRELILSPISAKKNYFVLPKTQKKQITLVAREVGSNHKQNLVEFEWGAEFFYPYQSTDLQKITIWEHNLEWDWEATESGIIGLSSIESCPLTLKYSFEDNNIKSEISFKNDSPNTIKDLVFKFRLNYSSSLTKIKKSENNVKEELLPPIKIDVNNSKNDEKKIEGQMISVFEGNEQNGAEYILPMEDVLTGEERVLMIQLSNKED